MSKKKALPPVTNEIPVVPEPEQTRHQKNIQKAIDKGKRLNAEREKRPKKHKLPVLKPGTKEAVDYGFLYIPGKTPRPEIGYHPVEICSILPFAFMESAYLYDTYKLDEFKEIGKIINQSIALGKWTIHLLVSYRRKYYNDQGHQNEFYKPDGNYDVNLKELTDKTSSADLSFLDINPHDYGEVATEDQEWLLWNYINKCNQILASLPEAQDRGNMQRFIDHCLASSFRICTKLNEYTDYFTKDLLNERKFDRLIPW